MQLLRLTLQLPRCLTTTDNEGDLPCTLVRIAPSTLTKTAAHMLASAIEKEEKEKEAAAQRLPGMMHGDEEDKEGSGDEEADSGVFVLPLPPAHEQEAISQLFVFGQLSSPETIHVAAKACGIEIALTDDGAISSFNEGHLHEVGLRLIQRHMASKHDYIRVFDHVYVSARQLFEPPSDAAAAMAPRFLEGVKLLPLLDTHTTAPFGKKGGGVLGLAISFEPQVYKWMPVDWAAVRAFAEHRLQEHEERWRLVRGENEKQCGGRSQEEQDGLDPFPAESEAALELLAVKSLPGLTGHGFIASLPAPTPAPTGLLRSNQRHGFDLHIPSTDGAMRRFWQHSYQIDLPAGPLEFCRIRFKGQDFSRAFTYPCACIAREVALSYSRTTQAYTRLSRAALDLLGSMPGVLTATYYSSASTIAPSSAPAAASARPLAPSSTATLALTPLKVGRAHANGQSSTGAASRLTLTSARQLRDRQYAQDIVEGEQPGGVPLLLTPSSTTTEERTGSKKGDKKEINKAPLPAPPAPTITTGRGKVPAAAAAAAGVAGAAGAAPQRPRGKQPRVLSLFEDEEAEDAEKEEGHGGEGGMGPPSPSVVVEKPHGASAKELMPPPPPPAVPKAPAAAKPKPKPKAKAAGEKAGTGNGGDGKKRKEAAGSKGPTTKGKKKAKAGAAATKPGPV